MTPETSIAHGAEGVSDSEPEFVHLGPCSQIVDGRGKAYVAQGQKVAVFRSGDRFFATENQCPHKAGPLASGFVEGHVVTCPWHGWEIDLETGTVLHDTSLSAPCFAVRVENGELHVQVPKRVPAPVT